MEKPNFSTGLRQLPTVLKHYWYVPTLLLIVAILFLAGSWYGKSQVAGQKAAGSRRILYYVDPMNPAHTSPEPGLAPCGMKFEPVYADDGDRAAGSAMPPGSVKITPEKQQIIGVRVATVEKSPWTHTLRTVGKVAVDETRIYRLKAFTEGWIVKVYNNSTGSLVRKDEPLATLYSKDLLTSLQAFFYSSYALDSLRQGQVPQAQIDVLEAQRRLAEWGLMNLGMGDLQIRDLARNKQITQEIILSAPATSFVLARNVTVGQKFSTGEEFYQLADLSRIWILADIFKNEAKYIRPGEPVRVIPAGQDESYTATVSEILPQFDPGTLTLKVRLEMDNPQFVLRPGMFMDVEFPVTLPASVNVPLDAIMDSGLHQTVFVDRDKGYFEPRRVKTGWRLGDRAEIVEGIRPGERIVVSGNFLVDSESRMKLAAAGFFSTVAKDPVCGNDLDEAKAKSSGLKSEHQGTTYYFCSEACQQKFGKTPERFAAKPEAGRAAEPAATPPKGPVAPAKVKDPVCGHEVDVAQAQAGGLASDYRGKTYYFCSYACNKQFDKEPQAFAGGSPAAPLAPGMAQDPVCGLEVARKKAQQAGWTSEYQGKTYYFDTDGCKQRFDQDPQRYLTKGSEVAKPQAYPSVPTDPNAVQRLRREILRTMPPGATLPNLPEPTAPAPPAGTPGTPPAAASPAPPAMPHGGSQVTPPAAAPAAPASPTAPMPPGATPVTPPGSAPAPPPTMPPGAAAPSAAAPVTPPPAPPAAAPVCPPGHGGQ
jgi:membrane fusion protein, copper/silver efflux system